MKDINETIATVDYNNHHYTFVNEFHRTSTKSHDVLIMTDENGHKWSGETTWINRTWHRFDLEEAWTEIVGKAFGKKAQELVLEINKSAHSVTDSIYKFFEKLDASDIETIENTSYKEFSDEDRRVALAKYLNVDLESVVSNSFKHEFEVDDATYLVLTNDEADEKFRESVESLWEDLGLECASTYTRDWILENALDDHDFEDFVRDDVENRISYMSDSELVDELIDNDICEYDDLYDESDEIKEDIDLNTYKDEFVEKKVRDEMQSQTFGEYLQDMGYEDDYIARFIDDAEAVEAIIDDISVNGSGRGQEIASYDGDELDISDDLFAYRID